MAKKPNGRKSNSGYKYVTGFKDRHGKTRWRFYRRGYPSCYLPSPEDPDFHDAYAKALTAGKKRRTIPEDRFDAAVDRYLSSNGFASHSESTRLNYTRRLSILGQKYGEHSIKRLRREHLVDVLSEYKNASERNRTLSLFRLVLQESVERGFIEHNVASSIGRLKQKTKGYVPWTKGEIEQFIGHHKDNKTAVLAILLLYYTGQRSSDVARMGAHSLKAGRIVVKQSKTKTIVDIPIHSSLAAVLPKEREIWLLTQYGKPFSVKGFQQWFVRMAKRAGIEGKSAHGLRKALATHLAESGATAHEIAAVTGHKTLSEVERYTAAANRAGLADTAFDKLG